MKTVKISLNKINVGNLTEYLIHKYPKKVDQEVIDHMKKDIVIENNNPFENFRMTIFKNNFFDYHFWNIEWLTKLLKDKPGIKKLCYVIKGEDIQKWLEKGDK